MDIIVDDKKIWDFYILLSNVEEAENKLERALIIVKSIVGVSLVYLIIKTDMNCEGTHKIWQI